MAVNSPGPKGGTTSAPGDNMNKQPLFEWPKSIELPTGLVFLWVTKGLLYLMVGIAWIILSLRFRMPG